VFELIVQRNKLEMGMEAHVNRLVYSPPQVKPQ